MGQVTLETERLRLVPLAEEHLEHAVELDSDPEVMRYLTGRPTPRAQAEKDHRRRLTSARDGLGHWAGISDGEFVGWWLLRPAKTEPVEDEAELGYRLRRRFWRRGLGSEGSRALLRHGFADLGLRRIFATTMAVNTASRATMTAVGLRHERTFHPVFDDPLPGIEHGEVEYALTRDQFIQLNS
ncbi:GNAT family N-acetyltransferase [Pseudonocardia nematodicida]|uniref:GNAT family N-acetyltransferase n=1 Tax=Pseudonocardia nematodicida TaxID=1206997 RepID=A0ABV1K8P6_9PSEU